VWAPRTRSRCSVSFQPEAGSSKHRCARPGGSPGHNRCGQGESLLKRTNSVRSGIDGDFEGTDTTSCVMKPRQPRTGPAVPSRRAFFSGAAGAAVAALAFPIRARADLACFDLPTGRVCEAGIPSQLIHASAHRNPQYQSQWCWAACISMIFGYHGHAVSQARIVRDAYGSIVDMPAMPRTILAALNRDWTDDAGRRFRAQSSFGGTTAAAAATDLAGDHPLIVGTHRHAVVLTSLQYRFVGPWGGSELLQATVRDPWPGRGRRPLSPREWAGINFAAHVRVQTLHP